MKSVIKSSSYMKEIATPDGVVDKVKARVVARENQQDKSIYTLDETSSPTVSTAAVLVTAAVDIASLPVLCCAIAAHEGKRVMTMNVETAYLNAKMIDDKPVYMRVDLLVTAILA